MYRVDQKEPLEIAKDSFFVTKLVIDCGILSFSGVIIIGVQTFLAISPSMPNNHMGKKGMRNVFDRPSVEHERGEEVEEGERERRQ